MVEVQDELIMPFTHEHTLNTVPDLIPKKALDLNQLLNPHVTGLCSFSPFVNVMKVFNASLREKSSSCKDDQ